MCEQGIKGFYWEGVKVVNTEIVLKLDPSNRLLIFETSQNRCSNLSFLMCMYVTNCLQLVQARFFTISKSRGHRPCQVYLDFFCRTVLSSCYSIVP